MTDTQERFTPREYDPRGRLTVAAGSLRRELYFKLNMTGSSRFVIVNNYGSEGAQTPTGLIVLMSEDVSRQLTTIPTCWNGFPVYTLIVKPCMVCAHRTPQREVDLQVDGIATTFKIDSVLDLEPLVAKEMLTNGTCYFYDGTLFAVSKARSLVVLRDWPRKAKNFVNRPSYRRYFQPW